MTIIVLRKDRLLSGFKRLITIDFKLNGNDEKVMVLCFFCGSLGYSQDWKTNLDKSC
jgi:hypothetical protein